MENIEKMLLVTRIYRWGGEGGRRWQAQRVMKEGGGGEWGWRGPRRGWKGASFAVAEGGFMRLNFFY